MIRLISGFTRVGDKIFTPSNGPFDAGKKSEAYLVSCGVAEYVDNAPVPVATGNTSEESVSPSVNTPEINKSSESDLDSSADIPEINVDMTAQELREIGKTIGVKFGIGTTKEEMVRVLREHYGINGDGEDVPDLSVETPIA